MRTILLAAAFAAVAAPLAAQQSAHAGHGAPAKPAGGGTLPAGWAVRFDPPRPGRAAPKLEDVRFVAMGGGFHVTSGPAAVYYNPKDAARGSYTVRGSFTQISAPRNDAYGVFFAGRNLQTPTQEYMYFLVRGTGEYIIKHRANDQTVHTIVDWTAHDAVKKADASGKATNTLAVVVGPEKVSYQVNGVEVRSTPPGAFDGQTGIRVNHGLELHVGEFKVEKK